MQAFLPRGKFSKTVKSRSTGKFLGQIRGDRDLLGPLILIIFTLFTIFKTSIINLPTEYLQIRRENTDLSVKNI